MSTPQLELTRRVVDPHRGRIVAIVLSVIGLFFAVGLFAISLSLVAAGIPFLLFGGLVLAVLAGSRAAGPLSWVLAALLLLASLFPVVFSYHQLALDLQTLVPPVIGLFLGLFVITLVRATRVRPDEESVSWEPLGGAITPGMRGRLFAHLALPAEGPPAPAAVQLFDAYFERVDTDWHGVAAEARARKLLPLYADVAGWIGLRRDGVAVQVAWAEEAIPDCAPDPRMKIAALASASERYPEARALLPHKPGLSHPCPACNGTGKVFEESLAANLLCGTCLGLGWRPG